MSSSLDSSLVKVKEGAFPVELSSLLVSIEPGSDVGQLVAGLLGMIIAFITKEKVYHENQLVFRAKHETFRHQYARPRAKRALTFYLLCPLSAYQSQVLSRICPHAFPLFIPSPSQFWSFLSLNQDASNGVETSHVSVHCQANILRWTSFFFIIVLSSRSSLISSLKKVIVIIYYLKL